MPRILIFGHLGQGNIGDELMFKPIVSALKDRFPEASITVLAGKFYDREFYANERLRRRPRTFRQLLASLINHDILIIAGGTHLHARRGAWRYTRGVLRHALIYNLARVLGLKVWLVGAGVGPFETGGGCFFGRLAVRAANFISIRDEESVLWLEKFGVPMERFRRCQDPASYLALPQRRCSGKHLGISVMCYFHLYSRTPERDQELAARFTNVIRTWFQVFPNSLVSLVAFYSGDPAEGDTVLAHRVKAAWQDDPRVRVIDPCSNAGACIEVFRDFTHFISMRYHSQVLASLFGIPQAVIAYHRKNHAFATACGLSVEAVTTVEDFVTGNGISVVNRLFHEQPSASPTARPGSLRELLPAS